MNGLVVIAFILRCPSRRNKARDKSTFAHLFTRCPTLGEKSENVGPKTWPHSKLLLANYAKMLSER